MGDEECCQCENVANPNAVSCQFFFYAARIGDWILRGQTLLAVLEILSGQAAILRDMVSLNNWGGTLKRVIISLVNRVVL